MEECTSGRNWAPVQASLGHSPADQTELGWNLAQVLRRVVTKKQADVAVGLEATTY